MSAVEQYARAHIVTDAAQDAPAGPGGPSLRPRGRPARGARHALPGQHEWVVRARPSRTGAAGPGRAPVTYASGRCGRVQAVMEFHSPEGVAVVQFDEKTLIRFLRRTYMAGAPVSTLSAPPGGAVRPCGSVAAGRSARRGGAAQNCPAPLKGRGAAPDCGSPRSFSYPPSAVAATIGPAASPPCPPCCTTPRGRQVALPRREPAVGLLLAVDLRRAGLRAEVGAEAGHRLGRRAGRRRVLQQFPAAGPAWTATANGTPSRACGRRPPDDTRYGWWKVPVFAVATTDAMFSGFIRTPPWPISDAAIWACDCTGTEPSKVDTPIAQSFMPSPNTCWACLVRSSSLELLGLADEGRVAGPREARLERAALDLELVVVLELPAAVRRVLRARMRLVRRREPLLDQQRRRDDLHRRAGRQRALERRVEAVA